MVHASSPRTRTAHRIARFGALTLCIGLAACQPAAAPEAVVRPKTVAAANGEDSGALSSAVKPEPTAKADVLKDTDWPPLQLVDGEAYVSCGDPPDGDAQTDASAADADTEPVDAKVSGVERVREAVSRSRDALARRDANAARDRDDAAQGGQDGEAASTGAGDTMVGAAGHRLVDLGFFSVVDAMSACRDSGGVRLRYAGKIGGEFTALMQRMSAMAERMDIGRRVLDLDSSGGRVEDAMRAGDVIAESRWIIDVRAGAICHSACSLVLAAGDDREIKGLVGIHRMIRIGSMATSRAEVSQELRTVYGQMKDYLERNGASVAVADLMMTVPNRSLRLLTADELQAYGLSGTNAVQDDLDRIRLTRQCGDEFVKRKDAYARAFDAQCVSRKHMPDDSRRDDGREALRSCDLTLRKQMDFPEDSCRVERPVAKAD